MNPPHWTMDEIGELTLPQIAILSHGGKKPSKRRREYQSIDEMNADLRAKGFCKGQE